MSLNRLREEGGVALIAAMLVLMVMVGLGLVVVAAALHSNDATVLDRQRENAFQAADAGFNNAVRCLTQVSPASWTVAGCQAQLKGNAGSFYVPGVAGATPGTQLQDGGKNVGLFHVEIVDVTPASSNTKRVEIKSWGYGPKLGGRSTRFVTATVNLVPNGGFFDTLFAAGPAPLGTIDFKNVGTVTGSTYALDIAVIFNQNKFGDVRTPGSFVSKNNDTYTSIWAGGNVNLGTNTTVIGDVLACGSKAAGDATLLSGASIGGNLTYKSSFSGTTSQVAGQITKSSCNPPPTLALPAYTYASTAYTNPVSGPAWNVLEFTSVLAANACLSTGTVCLNGGKTLGTAVGRVGGNASVGGTVVYVNVNPGACSTVSMTGNTVVENNFNLISPCPMAFGPDLSFSPTYVAKATVAAISTYTGTGDAIDASGLNSNDARVNLLLYATGAINFKNSTTIASGSVYGSSLSMKNAFAISRGPDLGLTPPYGFNFSGAGSTSYTPVTVLWTERGAPPTATP